MKTVEISRINKLKKYVVSLRDEHRLSPKQAKALASIRAKTLKISPRFATIFKKAWDTPRKKFHATDLGDSERFVAEHGKDLRYCIKTRQWYEFDGTRWAEVDEVVPLQRAKQTVRGFLIAAKQAQDPKVRKKRLSRWKRCETFSHLRRIIQGAQLDARISLLEEAFDCHPTLFNCRNGVVNLTTGELMPHDRNLYLTQLSPHEYHPEAKAPTFSSYVNLITGGDGEMRKYFRRLSGYVLTGETAEKAFFFFVGTTNTSKTTLLETYRRTLGEYARNADFSTFLTHGRKEIRGDIRRLQKARYVSASEAGANDVFDVPLIKRLTGNDTVTVREPYKAEIEYKPKFKAFMASNHVPKVIGADEAFWNRMQLILFQSKIPDEAVDPYFLDKLEKEMEGILAWMVKGAMSYYKAGGLNPPQKIVEMTDSFRSKTDHLHSFLKAKCEEGPPETTRETSSALREAWEQWCLRRGLEPGTDDSFTNALTAKGYGFRRTAKARMRTGISLRK